MFFGFVISWSFILPVRRADEFLAEVAAGNFGVTVRIPNRDEFGTLAENMNRMSRELQRLDEQPARGGLPSCAASTSVSRRPAGRNRSFWPA
jgi:methyl-accepting chemotaxis protein